MSIDSCYEDVIAKLTSQGKIVDISMRLVSLQSNDERVLYVYDILKELNAFPLPLQVLKSENVSTYYRNLGNKCFQKGEHYEALQYYNLSLLYSPLESDNYCLAISNRSAVLFSLRKFQECLLDIEKVFSMKYPENLKGKLLKRKTSCEEKVLSKKKDKIVSEIEKITTMLGPKNERYVCASSKLEVLYTEEIGRHVVAKEDIKVGEILAEEEPYFTLLLKSQLLFSCSYCLSRNMNLLPCQSCCYIMYCSEQCKDNAWRDYHSVECPLVATILKQEFTKLEWLALRTVIKARNDHPNWAALFITIKNAEKHQNTEFRGCIKLGDKWVYDSKYYASIHTLASNVEKRSVSDIFQKSITAAVFLRLLETKTDFLKSDIESEDMLVRSCVAGMLLLHDMTSPTNMHGISTNIQSAEGNFVDEHSLASAPYAFHSLLNHSCAPNVSRLSKLGTGTMTLFALRPIKKGMQLFDNYGFHHALEDRLSRVQSLKHQYYFVCSCEACCNNWPTYFGLAPARNLPASIRKRKQTLLHSGNIEKLQKADQTVAVNIYKPLCELAELLEPYAPCKELAECQETIKQCFAIFEGLVPYGFSKLVPWGVKPPKV